VHRISGEFGRLVRAAEDMDVVSEVRQEALLAGIQLDWEPPAGHSANYILYHIGRKNGVYLRTLGNTVLIVPPLAIGDDEIHQMVSGVLDTVRDVALR
jgi:adenosylmethionine-8-amino-7-oxononanoate aminotransferase